MAVPETAVLITGDATVTAPVNVPPDFGTVSAGLKADRAITSTTSAAVNGSLAKYNLQDQVIDEYETEAGVNTGDSTNQVYASGVSYSGGSGAVATGGTIDSSVTDYKIHTFLIGQTGTNFTPSASMNVEYLVVAGGGGGGTSRGGGGGAGGTETATGFAVTAQAYNIVVGAGGAGGTYSGGVYRGSIGGTSSFSTI